MTAVFIQDWFMDWKEGDVDCKLVVGVLHNAENYRMCIPRTAFQSYNVSDGVEKRIFENIATHNGT